MTPRPRTASRPRGLVSLPTILLVDPDEDARAMLRDALLEGAKPSILRCVGDSAGLGAFLHDRGEHAHPVPSLVLVDLDLPDGDGLAALRVAKSERPRVPVVGLSRRSDAAVVADAYDAGANSVLPRPVTFLALVRLMKVFTAYWLDAAILPESA
jgi:DNA-binding NarL/FixJ family response regulator